MTRIAFLCVVLTAACPCVAGAQAESKVWTVNAAATLAVSPGIGHATTAAGTTASVAVMRADPYGAFLERTSRGIGVVAAVHSIWAREPAGAQQWILGGPRWQVSDEGITLFVHALGGIKRSPGTDGSPTTFGALGAGLGFDFLAWRVVEVNWLAAPADKLSRHRLTVSSGVSLGWTLRGL